MADRGNRHIDRRISFPGVTIAALNESVARERLFKEHKSRNSLKNVIFNVKLDTTTGMQTESQKNFGTLKTCFNLHRLMDFEPEFEDLCLISRFYGKVVGFYKENSTGVHIVQVRQQHPKSTLVMDWQFGSQGPQNDQNQH